MIEYKNLNNNSILKA